MGILQRPIQKVTRFGSAESAGGGVRVGTFKIGGKMDTGKVVIFYCCAALFIGFLGWALVYSYVETIRSQRRLDYLLHEAAKTNNALKDVFKKLKK